MKIGILVWIMSKIKIKNVGPVKDGYQENDGWLDIKKVTLFIGNQGSGKSVVAKLISTFTWIEKILVRGDYDKKKLEHKEGVLEKYLSFHRLDSYIKSNTSIEYSGDVYSITYKNGVLEINESAKTYPLPQIMYVPAERNLLSYVSAPRELRLSSESLQSFLTEFDNAKNAMNDQLVRLPMNDVYLLYVDFMDSLYLKGKDYEIGLEKASSGFQSFVPLFLVSNYLAKSVKNQSENKEPMSSEEMNRFKKGVADIWTNENLTDEQKRSAVSVLASKFNKTAFINIVEEPEQNLFPSSQWQMLQCLLEFNNMNAGNKLILTTHSPYLVNFLSIAIQGEYLKAKIDISPDKNSLLDELKDIVSEHSLISTDSVVVYQFNERTGEITKLSASMGIPSDRNFLNDLLREGNQMFDKLLEIEEKL